MNTFTNTKESGLEDLIVKWLVEANGYEQGSNDDYSREFAIDEMRLFRFLQETQPEELTKLGVNSSEIKRKQFLTRLAGEISKRGIVDVLRNGIKAYPAELSLYYLTPNRGNAKAQALHAKNIFSVTRQLHHSAQQTLDALDVCIFLNGFPIITVELKNRYTGQTYKNAIKQYQEDRPATDPLFAPRRCAVHFAVDDDEIWMCSELKGKDSKLQRRYRCFYYHST